MLKLIGIRYLCNHFPPLLKRSNTNRLKCNEFSIRVNSPISSLFLSEGNRKIISNEFNPICFFHSDSKKKEPVFINFKDFHKAEVRNKKTFCDAIRIYEDNFQSRKGHIEFIESALKSMQEFGVHKDLEVYKKLLNIMPKGPFVAKNRIMVGMMYYPKQQFVILDLLDQMEHFGVIPDVELGSILKSIFGNLSYPYQKFSTILYWSNKFKNKSPWPVPKSLPLDPFLLGKMAIERITSVDIETEISVFQTTELEESIDKTWIVSGQSPIQKKLLKNHSPLAPVVVEGGDLLWLQNYTVGYFVLKADCEPYDLEPPKNADNLLDTESIYFNLNYTEEEEPRSCHEQDDGIIYAVCTTGTCSKDSLLSWVRLLQKNGNPILGSVPVLFRFQTSDKTPVIQTTGDSTSQ